MWRIATVVPNLKSSKCSGISQLTMVLFASMGQFVPRCLGVVTRCLPKRTCKAGYSGNRESAAELNRVREAGTLTIKILVIRVGSVGGYFGGRFAQERKV